MALAAIVNVTGIDTSITHTGLVQLPLDGWTDARIGAIKSAAPKTPKKPRGKGNLPPTLLQRHERFAKLSAGIIRWVVQDERPALVAIEQPAYSKTMGSMHDRSGLWWMIVQRLLFMEIPVIEISPSKRAKYATGRGIVDKDVVMAAVVRRYPQYEITNNNEADALVLAMMAARLLGRPLDDPPKTHLAAMDGLEVPAVVEHLVAVEPAPF